MTEETNNTIPALCRKLMLHKEAKARLEKELSDINKLLSKTESDLFNQMVLQEMDNLTVDGTSFSPKIKPMGSIKAEFKDKFFRSLRRRGMGALIKAEIHSSRLSGWVGEMWENTEGKLPQWITDCIIVYEKRTISTRKSK